jgi:hypothetical protein
MWDSSDAGAPCTRYVVFCLCVSRCPRNCLISAPEAQRCLASCVPGLPGEPARKGAFEPVLLGSQIAFGFVSGHGFSRAVPLLKSQGFSACARSASRASETTVEAQGIQDQEKFRASAPGEHPAQMAHASAAIANVNDSITRVTRSMTCTSDSFALVSQLTRAQSFTVIAIANESMTLLNESITSVST